LDAEQLSNQLAGVYDVVARLKSGVTVEQTQQALSETTRQSDQAAGLRVYSLRTMLPRDFRQTLLLLWGVVGFVLLIACANFANLLLARATNRQKELVIRSALGASRSRIVRQLLTESVLLSFLGGAVGLLLAYWVVQAIITAGPVSLSFVRMDAVARPIPRLGEAKINLWVMAFTSGVSLLTGMVFGLVPAWQFSKPDLNRSLKEGATISATGFRLWRHHRIQSLLVVAEIALALVLLIGAGLLVKSLTTLKQTSPGFQPDKILTIQFQFPWYRFRSHDQMLAFVSRISESVGVFPGVRSVSATSSLPLTEGADIRHFNLEKMPDAPPPDDLPPGAIPPPPPQPGQAQRPSLWAHIVNVAPRYFQTMGIPLQRGREFDPHDNPDAPAVVVINQAMAARYWPGADPLGQRVHLGGPQAPWATIVGVAANSRLLAREDRTRPLLYRPLLQSVRRQADGSAAEAIKREVDYVSLVVRTAGRAEDLMGTVQKEVRTLDPGQPILRIASMEEMLSTADALPRFNLFLFGVFAVLALGLAAIGIYGVMSYAVAQRTYEFGIRMALGAQSRDILNMVLRQGMTLVLTGVVIGLGGALALTRLLKTLLFGVNTTDPLTFGLIAVLLTTVALLACWIPARRATKVDPLTALRHE
jgi:putative ABC transport system permease protein